MKAEDFLKEKGIHPTEPIYWDTGDGFTHLNELLEEYADATHTVDKEVSNTSLWECLDNALEEAKTGVYDYLRDKLSSTPTPKPQDTLDTLKHLHLNMLLQEYISDESKVNVLARKIYQMFNQHKPQEEKMYSLNDILKWVSGYTTIEEFLHYATPN